MVDRYLIGNIIRISSTFTNLTGIPTNPTSVVLTIKKPDLTETTQTPTNDSAGNYHADITPDQVGMYYYYFAGTGAIVAATQGQFSIYNKSV
jgi:hypothetical protein